MAIYTLKYIYIYIYIYIFFKVLPGTVPTTSDTWLIDSGAYKHMTRYKENLSEVVDKDSHLRVVLRDDAN